MKKLSLFVAVILLSSAVIAQTQAKIGLKAGLNIANVALDPEVVDKGSRLGFHGGLLAHIHLSPQWGIQPEVMFSQTNTTTTATFEDLYKISSKELKDVKLNYLSIPLLLSFRPVSFFTFQAGPQFSILMNDHKNFLENGKEAFSNGDFSMVGGAQINILRLRVYGRYVVGLSNINDIDNQDKWKSQAIQVGVGFAL